jgi:hypothetical protein
MIRIWMTLVGLTLALGVTATGAGNPPLPQGNGLAARYPGDVGIAADPAVILADDFESYSSPSGLTSKWSSAPQGSNVRLSTEPGNFFGGAKALEFTIPQTSTETGLSIAKFPLNPERDVLFLRAYAKYGDGFNVVGSSHNGLIIQAHYCCPGVPADGQNKFFVSYEAARFDTSVPNPGQLAAYIYHPLQRDLYGDHFFPTGVVSPFTSTPFDFGPDFVPRPNVVPVLGRWYAYELMVQANTPGLKDGRIAMWLDGNIIADFTNLRLRDVSSLKIDRFSLDLHVKSNTLAVAKKWYDNVVAATSYIGPMVSSGSQTPRPPTNLRIVS